MDGNGTIKFKYVFSDQYNPIYVNGAVGGISPSGELTANFYLERQPVPREIEHEITAEGAIGPVIGSYPEYKVIRFVQNGVVLNLSGAKSIHKWLGEQIERLEEMTNDAKPGLSE